MSGNKIIETMGSIAKVEKLETLDSNILVNTLALEEVEPFPGYHGARNRDPPRSDRGRR